MFDELTEDDMRPVAVAHTPQTPPSSGSPEPKKTKESDDSDPPPAKQPLNGKKSGAIACFVLAALGVIVAIMNLADGEKRPEAIVSLIGYAVGLFLLPIAFLIGGLVLMKKSRKT